MMQDIGTLICVVLFIGFGCASVWAIRNDNADELYAYETYDLDPTLNERNAA